MGPPDLPQMIQLFPLAITFLALTCLAIAIPAPRPQSLQLPPDQPCYDVACIRDARQQDSEVEPKKEQNLLRMANLAPRGGHGRSLEDLVVEPTKEQKSLRMDLVPSKKDSIETKTVIPAEVDLADFVKKIDDQFEEIGQRLKAMKRRADEKIATQL